jgi:D-amino peptidase
MISGDDAAVAEARSVIGDIEGAIVKWNYSFHSAKTLTPGAAYKLIGEKVAAAIARIEEFEPLVLPAPVTLDVRFKAYRPSQLLAYLTIVERTDAHSIRFVGSDIVEVSRFLEFMMSYSADLEP